MDTENNKRLSWDDYFLGLAFAASQRSIDQHTKHGCIIVDCNHHILGVGYNSFPRKMKDDSLPLTRPEKYPWMIHSEVNAVSNCSADLWSYSSHDLTAYITGLPCSNCSKFLWQNNIGHWKIAKRQGTLLETNESKKELDILIAQTEVHIDELDINIDWLKNIKC